MNDFYKIFYLLIPSVLFISCGKKTARDRAIELVESKYEPSGRKLDFEQAKLDSLYTISPKAYADSLEKGKALDDILAILESQIEQYPQKESDSIGQISAKLTEQRYRLLELAKKKPTFVGWELSGVKVKEAKSEVLSFTFNKSITKFMP